MKNFIIKNSKTGWMWASDDMPNTIWTPELDEAQRYASAADAEAEFKTLHPADQDGAAVVEVGGE